MPSTSDKVTLKTIEKLKDGDFVWDRELRGFGVRARSAGLYYVLKTRVRGQQRWFTIGKHGSPWTPETARRKALALLGEIARGEDPAEVREDLKRRMSLAELCEIYLREGCSDKKASTLATDKGRIERHIVPLLGKKDVRAITRRDIEQFMRDVADGKRPRTSAPANEDGPLSKAAGALPQGLLVCWAVSSLSPLTEALWRKIPFAE